MNGSRQHDTAVRSTANDLEDRGYSVIIEPNPSLIPFDLHPYRPDILATRGDENLIIEIKTRGSHRPIERYKEIAEIVGRHKNWRFMLSTIDEIEPTESAMGEEQIDPRSLNNTLDKLGSLLEGENYNLALPYLWSVYISAMRIVGERANVPMDITSDRSVLNYMYSLGEISSDEYELARKFLNLRNKAVHKLEVDVSRETILEMCNHIKNKLLEWGIS
ncbi:MAG: hypothetical protein VKK04_20125 [Synechococcales bacterium]|nr:hypothetical protein [Synechococcales bacterium]